MQAAKQLRLYGISQSLERRYQEAVANELNPNEFIRLLLEDEIDYRKGVKARKLVRQAKFRNLYELEDWDTSFDRGITKAKQKELALLNFYHKTQNLIILGKTGEGKTHIAISLGKRLCDDGTSVSFFSVNLLFEELQAQKAAGTYLKFIQKIKKIEALILDDFALRNYSHEEANLLLELLEERYRNGIVILTSQVDSKGWKSLFEDPVIAEAIVDRLINPSDTIKLKGGSYRERL